MTGWKIYGAAIVGLATTIEADDVDDAAEQAEKALRDEADRLGVLDAEPLVEVDHFEEVG